jgi:hypothetical protein
MSWEARLFVESDIATVLKVLTSAFVADGGANLVVPPAQQIEARADLYVSAANDMDEFGLKFRDMTSLELKSRSKTHSVAIGERNDVIVAERWSKQRISTSITCPNADKLNSGNEWLTALVADIDPQVPPALRAALASGACAVSVAKRRWSVRLSRKPLKAQIVEVADLTIEFVGGGERAPLRVVSLCVEGGSKEDMSGSLVALNNALTNSDLKAFIGGYPAFISSQLQQQSDDKKQQD